MTIQRVPQLPFAQIANDALRDKRLSFRARGILAMVLSHIGEWEASKTWLSTQGTEGRDAIQSALNELTELGYRVVTHEQCDDGIRTVVEWRHAPDMTIPRSTGNPPAGDPAHRESRTAIEHHPSEHHQTEHQEQAAPSAQADAETLNQRINRLARIYTDLVPMSKFPAVMLITRKAIGAGFDDEVITAALQRLASEGRSLTVETLRIELEGLPTARQRPSRAQQAMENYRQSELSG